MRPHTVKFARHDLHRLAFRSPRRRSRALSPVLVPRGDETYTRCPRISRETSKPPCPYTRVYARQSYPVDVPIIHRCVIQWFALERYYLRWYTLLLRYSYLCIRVLLIKRKTGQATGISARVLIIRRWRKGMKYRD